MLVAILIWQQTYVEGFKLRSDIACLKALEKAYGRKEALSIYRYFRQAE